MIRLKNKFIVSLFLILIITQIKAQMINKGNTIVSPNTLMSVHTNFINIESGNYINDGETYFYQNFTNDGLTTFTEDEQGITYFVGNQMQQINGSLPADFYDIVFDNPTIRPAFELSNVITVSNKADFLRGIVKNRTFGGLVIFQQDGFHTSASDDSHVEGEVLKVGDIGFEFPVGDGGLFRPALISAPINSTDEFTTEYLLENANSEYPLNKKQKQIEFIDNTEYWIIRRTAGNSEVVVTLTWNQTTTPSEILDSSVENIHVVRWDKKQGIWIDEGGIADASNKRVSSLFVIKDYEVFTLARVKGGENSSGDLIIHDVVTPNGDGLNDIFFIKGLENYPDNTLSIYNRWGVLVYKANGYGSNSKFFRGFSEGRVTINKANKLPVGTYFYVLKYKDAQGKSHDKAGDLYIQY